ncbi:MAG: A24 family peptidase [Nanoarchaeota archaeon]|nr:A24 family peptidase [Nanoarchaeota archaeon]
MLVEVILIVLVLCALVVASITDIRSREVPDWVSYMLIAAAFVVRLWYAFSSQHWSFFGFGVLGFALASAIGLVLFFSKQWGGGDAKLLMGFGVVFATNPSWYASPIPLFVAVLFNLVVVGAVYGIVASLLLAFVHHREFMKSFMVVGHNKWLRLAKVVGLLVAVGLYLFVTFADVVAGWILLVIASILVVYPWLLQVMKAVEQACLVKKVPVAKVTEGDWLVDDAVRKRFAIPSYGIEAKQLKKLQSSKIAFVVVKEGIPFVPALLVAVVVSLVFGFWLPVF